MAVTTADPDARSFVPINPWAMLRSWANNNLVVIPISGAPTNGTSGTLAGLAAPGSTVVDITTGNQYINIGTLASPTWQLNEGLGILQIASGTISSANITGTGVGQLGHANGVPLVAGAGATKIQQLICCLIEMNFATAAYTGGGATGIKLSGGGVAVSNTVTAAVFIQAAANISVMIEPPPSLTVPSVYVLNAGLNLVSAAAPTQPGTAAGVIRWTLYYRTLTSLLQ